MRHRTGAAIAALLSRAWRADGYPPLALTEAEIERLVHPVAWNGAAAIAWWRLRGTPLASTAVAGTLRDAYRTQALRAALFEQRLRTLFAALRGVSAGPILAKGWGAARFYADAGLRPYGDIDVLVDPAKFDGAKEILQSAELRGFDVDLHRAFTDLPERTYEALHERSYTVAIDGEPIRILGHEDHLRLIALHCLRHLAWRPIWLCDIAAATEAAGAQFDWDLCVGGDARRSEWIITMLQLARHLLGAESASAPAATLERPPAWLQRDVLGAWSKPYVEAPASILPSLRAGAWKDLRTRWPGALSATLKVRAGPRGPVPRITYQLAVFVQTAATFLWKFCRGRAAQ